MGADGPERPSPASEPTPASPDAEDELRGILAARQVSPIVNDNGTVTLTESTVSGNGYGQREERRCSAVCHVCVIVNCGRTSRQPSGRGRRVSS
jgi:hypothetical protein